MARVEAGGAAVAGNHDLAVVSPAPVRMGPEIQHAIDWTREKLDTAQLAFLRDLPLKVEEEDRLYVHANAWAPDGGNTCSGPPTPTAASARRRAASPSAATSTTPPSTT